MWFDDWINRKWYLNSHKEPIHFYKWKKVVSCESAPSFVLSFEELKLISLVFSFGEERESSFEHQTERNCFQWKENRLFLSSKIIVNERTHLQYFDRSPWWRKALPWQLVPVSLTVLDALDLHLGYSTACDTIQPYPVIEPHESVAYDPTPNHDETYTFHVLQKQFEREKIHKKNQINSKGFARNNCCKFNWNGNENIQARTYILIIPFHHIMSLDFTHSSWETHTQREIVWISRFHLLHTTQNRGVIVINRLENLTVHKSRDHWIGHLCASNTQMDSSVSVVRNSTIENNKRREKNERIVMCALKANICYICVFSLWFQALRSCFCCEKSQYYHTSTVWYIIDSVSINCNKWELT